MTDEEKISDLRAWALTAMHRLPEHIQLNYYTKILNVKDCIQQQLNVMDNHTPEQRNFKLSYLLLWEIQRWWEDAKKTKFF